MRINPLQFLLFLTLFICSCGLSKQQKTSYHLNQILLESSQDTFSINKSFKLIEGALKEGDEYVYEILFVGDISSLMMNFNLISYLPSLKERTFGVKMEFNYFNLNEDHLYEALVIDYLNTISNDTLIDYLLKRATNLFENDPIPILQDLGVSIAELNSYISLENNQTKVSSLFTNPETKERGIFVHGKKIKVKSKYYKPRSLVFLWEYNDQK